LIGRLVGRIVDDDGAVVLLDVAGVGYEVTMPLGTRGRLSADPAATVTVWVHTHVREDALDLFGFASSTERTAFRTIIGVPNVGPKLALAILGSVTVSDLATLVMRGDTAKLTQIPGVGKKTAERLVLELKGKLDPGPAVGAPSAVSVAGPPGSKADLLTGALTRMGYRPSEAERAVAALVQSGRDLEQSAVGDLVREALAVLSR
jgi:Holliday junction DNA helicase RuvA